MTDAVIVRDIFDRLRQATAGDPNVLVELCREYVAEARSTIGRLREALAQGDAAQVRDRAHYLKGSSMMIGAEDLWQCCATLERMGKDADLTAAQAALERTLVALRAVEEELAKEFGSVAWPAEGSAA